MGTNQLRRDLIELLRQTDERASRLCDELHTAFLVEHSSWVKSSPKRRDKEERIEDTISLVHGALVEIRKALAELDGGHRA